MTLPMKRMRPGHYQATLPDGAVAEVEYLDFREEFGHGYNDHGWVWWVDGMRSDFPVATKWYAVQLLEYFLDHQRASLNAYMKEKTA